MRICGWLTKGLLIALLVWSIGGVATAAVVEQERKSSAGGETAPAASEPAQAERSMVAPAEVAPQISELEMVAIQGGCFEMGSPEFEVGRFEHEHPHLVCVEGFQIDRYEITQRQWREVTGSNPSFFSDCDGCPVEQVSWRDVQDYLVKLNAQTGKHYRLPTEAEWEYACRSGRSGDRYCGGDDLEALAWSRSNSESKTHPVGGKQSNGLGLYDMSGNAWEWTCSAFDESYQGSEMRCASADYAGQLATRGGGWYSEPRYLRAAVRDGMRPGDRQEGLGFRLAED
jgi:formylglycine-generating enzyme required for sulfatase activity